MCQCAVIKAVCCLSEIALHRPDKSIQCMSACVNRLHVFMLAHKKAHKTCSLSTSRTCTFKNVFFLGCSYRSYSSAILQWQYWLFSCRHSFILCFNSQSSDSGNLSPFSTILCTCAQVCWLLIAFLRGLALYRGGPQDWNSLFILLGCILVWQFHTTTRTQAKNVLSQIPKTVNE